MRARGDTTTALRHEALFASSLVIGSWATDGCVSCLRVSNSLMSPRSPPACRDCVVRITVSAWNARFQHISWSPLSGAQVAPRSFAFAWATACACHAFCAMGREAQLMFWAPEVIMRAHSHSEPP